MSQKRQRTGKAAEDLVAARLESVGWTLLERNARTRYGELDIVALNRSSLVFVEVKAAVEGAFYGPERPILAVGPAKQRRLAGAWLSEAGRLPPHRHLRFDAVGVTYDRAGRLVDYEHLANAF